MGLIPQPVLSVGFFLCSVDFSETLPVKVPGVLESERDAAESAGFKDRLPPLDFLIGEVPGKAFALRCVIPSAINPAQREEDAEAPGTESPVPDTFPS